MTMTQLRTWSPLLGLAVGLAGCDLPDLDSPRSTAAPAEDAGGPGDEEPVAGSESGEPEGDASEGDASEGDAPEGDAAVIWDCTHTRGYWQTHHSEGVAQVVPWPLPEDAVLCGSTWIDILWTPPSGSSWGILAAQWIAASLNVASGADAPPAVVDALARGEAVLESCEVEDTADAMAMADLLDRYNNGLEGVAHCDDVPDEDTDGEDSGDSGDTEGSTSAGDTSGGDTTGGDGDTGDCVYTLEGGSNCGETVFPPIG